MSMGHANKIWIPSLILISGSLLFMGTDLDPDFSALFYSPEKEFLYKDAKAWVFLYEYGNIPSLIMAIGGLVVSAISLFWRKLTPFRRIGLFLALSMSIGPGLIVNGAFKGHWGRPRPREIVQFGGQSKFLPLWEKGVAGQGKSFPSGHASVGYFLFMPFFFPGAVMPRAPRRIFLALGLGCGTLMGLGRIVQGAHFASDVLWSAGFVYLTGLGLSYIFGFHKGNDAPVAKTPKGNPSG